MTDLPPKRRAYRGMTPREAEMIAGLGAVAGLIYSAFHPGSEHVFLTGIAIWTITPWRKL